MNIIERIKNIVLTPKTEWPVIESESATVQELYTSYIMLLAAIPALAGFVGMSLIGMNVPVLGHFRIPMMSGITMLIVSYALNLAMIYVLALIIDALAPSFASEKNFIQAFKLATYSFTASWLTGIFSLIPALSPLAILGLYSLYVLYVGLPIIMKTPADKVVSYFVVLLIASVIAVFIIGTVVHVFAPNPMAGLATGMPGQ